MVYLHIYLSTRKMDGMDNWVVMGRGAHHDTNCHCDSTLKTDDFKKS